MYSNVKTLLQNERHPEFYSLDMETDNENYLGTENPIERFYMYKSGNVDKQSVYEGAVRYRELNEDTMTSLQHSLNLAFELIETEEDRKKYFKGKKVSLAYQIELLFCTNDFMSRASKINGLESFARLYHTVGNMIPVPPMFNTSRSNFGANDYWDVTLTKIKKWYDTHDNTVIAELLHKSNANDKAVLLCEKWLSWFGSWSEFIAKNYLDDFVDDQKIEPIRFKPDTANDVKAFFEICSSLIEKRVKRMVEELKSRVL